MIARPPAARASSRARHRGRADVPVQNALSQRADGCRDRGSSPECPTGLAADDHRRLAPHRERATLTRNGGRRARGGRCRSPDRQLLGALHRVWRGRGVEPEEVVRVVPARVVAVQLRRRGRGAARGAVPGRARVRVEAGLKNVSRAGRATAARRSPRRPRRRGAVARVAPPTQMCDSSLNDPSAPPGSGLPRSRGSPTPAAVDERPRRGGRGISMYRRGPHADRPGKELPPARAGTRHERLRQDRPRDRVVARGRQEPRHARQVRRDRGTDRHALVATELQEVVVEPAVVRELRMERGRKEAILTCGDDAATLKPRQDLDRSSSRIWHGPA